MEKTSSMEHILVTQFIVSLPVVLKPCYAPHQSFAQSVLHVLKDVICDRTLSLQMLQVLVEAITPLSKFSVGLNTPQDFEKDIKSCLPTSLSTCYVMPVKTISELSNLLDLLKTGTLHTPPLTPTSPDDENISFQDDLKDDKYTYEDSKTSEDSQAPPTPISPDCEDIFCRDELKASKASNDCPPLENTTSLTPTTNSTNLKTPKDTCTSAVDSLAPLTPTTHYGEDIFLQEDVKASLQTEDNMTSAPGNEASSKDDIIILHVQDVGLVPKSTVSLVQGTTGLLYPYTREELLSLRHNQCNIKLPLIAYVLRVVQELQETRTDSIPPTIVKRKVNPSIVGNRPPLLQGLITSSFVSGSMTQKDSSEPKVKYKSSSLSVNCYQDCPAHQTRHWSQNSLTRADFVETWEHDLFDPNQ